MLKKPKNDPLEAYPDCKNCGAPHWPGERHCAECGQKVYTGPPTVWQLIGDFFETLFNIDNRIFRTLRDLMIPGKLTNAYLYGKQKSYLNPLRFFFITAVLLVGALAIIISDNVKEDLHDSINKRREAAYRNLFVEKLDQRIDSIQLAFPDTVVRTATDSLHRLMASKQKDSMSLSFLSHPGGFKLESKNLMLSKRDIQILTPDEIADQHDITGRFDRFLLIQNIRVNNLSEQGVNVLVGQSVWGLLLIIPLTALMLKLFYIRRKKKYVEHFVSALHVHTFIFLVNFLAILFVYFTDNPNIFFVSGGLSLLYLPIALKRVYQQSWLKTLLKLSLMFFIYFFIIIACIVASALISVALF